MRRVAVLVVGLLAGLLGWQQVVHGFTNSYDAVAVAHAELQQELAGADDTTAVPSDARSAGCERSVVDRGPSTTPFRSIIATEGVGGAADDVVSTPAGEYVGQSGNISTRLEQHVASGKFTQAEVDAAERFAVQGTKLDREIAEQLLIDSKGGIGNLLNKVNPIGPKRFGVMPNQPYVR